MAKQQPVFLRGGGKDVKGGGGKRTFLFPFTGGPRVPPVPVQRPRFKEGGAQGQFPIGFRQNITFPPGGAPSIPDRVGPALGPLKSTGLPVNALAFTGRGVAMVIPAKEFASVPGARQRVKIGPVPFRGFVRDFNIIELGVADEITYLPIFSTDDDEQDLMISNMGSDTSLVTVGRARLAGAPFAGYGFFIGGSHPLASPNFLLPPGPVWLGVHVGNGSVGSIVAEFSFEVLEVVE